MKHTGMQFDTNQVLSAIEKYSAALDLLDAYDHETMQKPKGNAATYVLEYEECRSVIDQMKFAAESSLFGNEKDDSFKGSIANIYQVFGGVEMNRVISCTAAQSLMQRLSKHPAQPRMQRNSAIRKCIRRKKETHHAPYPRAM